VLDLQHYIVTRTAQMTSTEPQTTYDLQATAGALADRVAGHATPVRLHLAALALALSAHAAVL
jgi:hypothetical protein